MRDPIRYILRFPAPHTHYVEVEGTFPTDGKAHIDLFMAVWTPGSYLIREYERHVENVRAHAEGIVSLPIEKTAKNRWRVATAGAARLSVRYRVYGRELTVRNNWIEAGFALLNGAPTFMSLVDGLDRRHEIQIVPASGWNATATALVPIGDGAHGYAAEDFHTLVDSPIVVGNPVQRQFIVGGKPHTLTFEGDPALIDIERVTADVTRIVEATVQLMAGRVDYPHYYFLNLIVEAGGGLEHTNCCVVMANRFATRTRRAYLAFLSLTAHEFFHAWNIKRLRPIELGGFDYEREVYTKNLWMCEGFTDYYAALLLRRSGVASRDEFFDELSGHIETLQTTPGRLVTSAAMSSFDTWIKQYRPDENTPNTTINYYPKGAVIAFLLDAHIRHITDGAKSLDDAMRLAYQRYSGPTGYTTAELYQTISEVAGVDLGEWFALAVDRAEDLDYTEALEWFGLRFRPVVVQPRAWTGALTRADHGRLVVAQVRRDTPAHHAGINVDDEIVAIDDVRVTPDGFNPRLEQYRPGETVSVVVARRERLMRLELTFAQEPARSWRLEPLPLATDQQKRRLAQWLGN